MSPTASPFICLIREEITAFRIAVIGFTLVIVIGFFGSAFVSFNCAETILRRIARPSSATTSRAPPIAAPTKEPAFVTGATGAGATTANAG